MEGIFHLRLLGPVQVERNGEPVYDLKSRKALALLGYLAGQGQPISREHLADLFWGDKTEARGRANLSWTLNRISVQLPGCLQADRHTVQFQQATSYWLDLDAFAELQAQGEATSLAAAIELYRGEFLEGLYLAGCAEFEIWLVKERERWRQRVVQALEALVTHHSQRGECEASLRFAQRLLALEPWREETHCRVMRLLARSGQRSAALAQYETCRRILAEELEVEPAAETTQLYEQIRDGELEMLVSLPHPPAQPPPFLDKEAADAQHLAVEKPIFVARQRELARLDGFLNAALAGRGRVVFVTGDAGQGKTALIQEFARRAQAAHPDPSTRGSTGSPDASGQALVVASGNGNAHTGIGDPYLPFREVLSLLTGDVEARWAAGAMSSDQARRLWHTLPLTAQALVEVGPDLIDLFVPGAALVKRAVASAPVGADWLPPLQKLVQRKATLPPDPSLQQKALFEQYTRLVEALARQRPLLLVLDDLQWADAGSVNLLFHLGRRIEGSRVLVVGAYRPEEVALGRGDPSTGSGQWKRHPLEPVVNEFKRHFGNIEVNLRQAEGREFVDAFLDTEPNRLGDAFRQTLYRQTRGHPLFTIELLRGMQERGDLVQDQEGRWVEGRDLDWDALPARVEAVIAERIERLEPTQRQVLKVASVEGETFTAEVVAQVLGEEPQGILSLLSNELDKRHRLVGAQNIRQVDGRRLSIYRFQHILFQRYLHGSLDAVERSNLHQAVGTVLQDLYAEGREEISGQLARHFREAGTNVQAADYQVQAGDRAVKRYAYQEAVDHYQQAQAAYERALGNAWDPLERADLERKIGEALYRRGNLPQALEHLRKALFHLDCPLPTSRWGVRLTILAELLKQLWHRLTPGSLVKPGVGQVSPRLLLWMRIAESIVWAAKFSDREALLLIVLRALNLSESSGMLEGIVLGSVTFGLMLGFSGLLGLAEGYQQRAVTLAEESQDSRNLAHAYMGMGNHQLCLGKLDAAHTFAVRSANAYRQAGDIHQQCFLEFLGAWFLVLQGKFAQALATAKNLVMQGDERVDPQIQCWGLGIQGDVLRRSGDIPEAIKVLEEAVELTNTISSYEDRINMGGELGRCFVRLGQIEKALSVLDETRRVYLTEYGTTWHADEPLYNGLAEAALWIAEQDTVPQKANLSRANQACREALKRARVLRIRLPDAMRLQANYKWLSGDRKAAQKMWKQGLKLTQEQGQYYDEGVILLDMGSRLGDRSHLEKAITILSEIGEGWDLARAHEALGKLSDQA